MLAEVPPQAPHFTVKIPSAMMAISQSTHNSHAIPGTYFCSMISDAVSYRHPSLNYKVY